MITILLTISAGKIGGNAAARPAVFHRNRIHPVVLGCCVVGDGELQPRKWTAPSLGTTSNRGAPAPQCEPSGSVLRPSSLMSEPSSVSVMPLTLISSAVAAAKLAVGLVLTRSKPGFGWALRSPGGPASS